MALIRANRDSITDRFSVLGFTVSTQYPLFEIGLTTDPDLLKSENKPRRTSRNFFSSRILGAAASSRGEAVYLVPPNVIARFVGQPRLYFGLASYQENDRVHPVSVRIPDSGNMYVNLSGLTERGLRRTARLEGSVNGYGSNGVDLGWGGDVLAAAARNGATKANGASNGANVNGNVAAKTNGSATTNAPGKTAEPAPYSDGYSDDLWKHGAAPAPSKSPATAAVGSAAPTANANAPVPSAVAIPPATAPAATATAQAYAQQAYGGFGTGMQRRPPQHPVVSKPLLVGPYYQPSGWVDALTSQISFFLTSTMWYLGVTDTTVPPHAAICQVRRPDGSDEGALHGSAFFISPCLLLTAAHVVDGQSELIIVRGKNGAGTGSANEPFGRFRVSATDCKKHPSYVAGNEDFDMAVIRVSPANAAPAGCYFDLVEELTQSRPEGVVVCGYAARWYATDAIERFVNETIDPNKQHMMGGYIRSLPSDETFDYDLQTLGGTSGSPVYWLEGGDAPRAHMVGVHVAAHSATTNLGCRMTPAKRQWIAKEATGLGVAFSLGVARSLGYHTRALGEEQEDADAFGFTGPMPDDAVPATTQGLRARALDAPAPDYPGASRFVPAHAHNFSVGRKRGVAVDRIVIHTTDGAGRTEGTIGWFQNPDQRDANNQPRRGSSHYIVGRDGEVVQMVRNADTSYHASSANWRSIGIEHETSTRLKLDPNEAEYVSSAWLVAWLCAQFNLPIDREHIVGHQEISPRDNHDCPGSAWNWDHYMDCVRSAATAIAVGTDIAAGVAAAVRAIAAPLTQGLSQQGLSPQSPVAGRKVVRSLEVITPFYDPADPSSALSCQNDAFSLAREEWFAGVPNTTIFPHSAICQLNMTAPDGSMYGGTGFYIGSNRILTCAHNLSGMSSVQIIPGRNGASGMPFGQCTVNASSWRVAPGYTGSGNWDNDLAVIDNVPLAAPNGQTFKFLNASPSDRLPVAVCGYSAQSDAVPALTDIIDGDMQHLHGGYIRGQSNLEVIEYPILTLHGASGSPVYNLSSSSGSLQALVCGVHVTGQPAAQGLNRGCFITPRKIDWIEGRATSFSLGARALDVDEDSTHGIDGPIPDDVATAQSLAAVTRALAGPSPEYPQANRFVAANNGNFRAVSGVRAIERVVIHITDGGANINGTVGWFQNPSAKVSAHYVIGQDGEIVQMVRHNDVAWHARSANGNSIGIEHVANTRGLRPTPAQLCASAALVSWLCDQFGIAVDRTHILGHSEADPGTSHSGCPNAVWDWTYYMGMVTSRTCYAPDAATATPQSLGYVRALDAQASDYPVALIPQPDKNACWAASMAMLLSWRRSASFAPDTLANEVGASLASSYNWDLLNAVRSRYGFEMVQQPSNTSLYHTPQQWADWLAQFGALWVVIVGAPHAVVLAGIRGNLADPASAQVKLLNPWDTRVSFDNDPVAFNPPNQGYQDWISFQQFASDFGNMAQPDYGNWRVLYLPATATTAQSLAAPLFAGNSRLRLARPPAPVRARALEDVPATSSNGNTPEPIEPTRVPGTRMSTARGRAGACSWALDQLEGLKLPATPGMTVSSSPTSDVSIDLGGWPAIEGEAAPLPMTLTFRANPQGAVGDVQIRAGTPANLAYGIDVSARIDNDTDVGAVAALKVGIDYRFSGLAQGAPSARIELRLLGDGRWERANRWLTTTAAA